MARIHKTRPVAPGVKVRKDARSRLFDAAVKEFAVHGLAGARTDVIAKAAGVNIALLFYYFKSKEELYDAVLDEMFSRWSSALLAPLQGPGTPERRIVKYMEAFFDHVAESVWRPRLVQQELMRSNHSPAVRKLLKKYVKPVHKAANKVLRAGIAGKSFRADLDVENFIYSIHALVAQYFSNSSAILEISGKDPLSAERVQARRAAVLDMVRAALLFHKQ